LTKNESPAFNLWEKGIFVEKYKLGEKEYNVAVYSFLKDIALKSSDIKLIGYKNLAKSMSVKAGYTKKYGLITFYDESKNAVMTLQLWSDDLEKTTAQWLNYLAIVVASEEQREYDKNIWEKLKNKINQLFETEELSKLWGEKEKSKDIILDNVRWISQFSAEINGRNCHWCGSSGLCCNGGTPCLTCPNDSTGKTKCCQTVCTDSLQTTACDSCKNEVICKTGTCKSNNCCFQTALAMIEQFGVTTNRSQAIDIATLKNSKSWKEQSDLQADVAKFEENITYIDETLASGNPVLIGVHYQNKYREPYNANKATFHYMVIVGKIHKNNKEYYWFYDPGRIVQNKGISTTNLLEIDRNKNMIHGIYKNNKPYTITEVRKNL
jgi:hypothetical protein